MYFIAFCFSCSLIVLLGYLLVLEVFHWFWKLPPVMLGEMEKSTNGRLCFLTYCSGTDCRKAKPIGVDVVLQLMTKEVFTAGVEASPYKLLDLIALKSICKQNVLFHIMSVKTAKYIFTHSVYLGTALMFLEGRVGMVIVSPGFSILVRARTCLLLVHMGPSLECVECQHVQQKCISQCQRHPRSLWD